MKTKIAWLGHNSVRLVGSKVVYFDPWKLKRGEPKADVVLITHSHYDHLSRPDLDRVSRPGTVVVAPADGAAQLPPGFRAVTPGQTLALDGLTVETVPAYNPAKQFHPKSNGWVGYVVAMDGERFYLSGDTDRIPEMDGLQVDVALLPVGGTYTMTAAEAAAAANAMRPTLAIPIHWGDIVGTRDDAETFKRLCRVPVEILAVTT